MDLLFFYSFLCFLLRDPNIIDGNLPCCSRCIHYRNYLSFLIPNNELGKCSKFGTKNIVTGKINYEYADYVRDDESKCGHNGNLFKPREFPLSILDKIFEDKCNIE